MYVVFPPVQAVAAVAAVAVVEEAQAVTQVPVAVRMAGVAEDSNFIYCSISVIIAF